MSEEKEIPDDERWYEVFKPGGGNKWIYLGAVPARTTEEAKRRARKHGTNKGNPVHLNKSKHYFISRKKIHVEKP